MIITTQAPTYVSRASGSTPPAEEQPKDQYTPLARFLGSLDPIPRGMIVGEATMAPPMLGGLVAGFPGLAAGAALSFGFHYAIDKDPRRALGAVIWPAILGGILATSSTPTPLTIGVVAGMGLALGAVAGWRAKMEEKILKEAGL